MLALAMLMPAMLLTTACSNSDDEIVNTENPTNTKGYALPVTINVTRQGDATTRATYTDNGNKTGSLSFSAGDKLFVRAESSSAGQFAGLLDYDSETGKFSGDILTQYPYSGTVEGLLTSATNLEAFLMPAGYEGYGFLGIADEGTYYADLSLHANKAFVLTKAAAVEQFSHERSYEYDNGFELSPGSAVLNFTISGLAANADVIVSLNRFGSEFISESVATDASGVATFAIGILRSFNMLGDYTLTVGGNAIALPDQEVVAGHIYNISRSMKVIWNSSKVAGISISEDPEENSFGSDGITVAAFGDSGANFKESNMSVGGWDGYFTFTSSVGNIKKIEINYTGDVLGYEEEPPVGWSLGGGTFTWEGDPATSVTLPSSGYSSIEGITSIVFTLE